MLKHYRSLKPFVFTILLSVCLLSGTVWLMAVGGETAVAAPLLPPQANDDTYTLTEDIPLMVISSTGVLSNDLNATQAFVSQSPGNGTIDMQADGGFTYTPTLNYFGTDTFTYLATEGTQPVIAYWPADDNVNPTADLSGLGHQATLNGNVTFTTNVPPTLGSGMALDFSGGTVTAGGAGDHLGADHLTVAFWLKIDSIGGWDYILRKGIWDL